MSVKPAKTISTSIIRITWPALFWLIFVILVDINSKAVAQEGSPAFNTTEIHFQSHDGYEMFGKLTMPASEGPHAIVMYVQTAEASTVDTKRAMGPDKTFNYYDIYRTKFAEMNVGFFSYEGRAVRMGDKPPMFQEIDREMYNTSTLENKVRDALSALEVVRKQPGVNTEKIFLMGASEATLLAAETAVRAPDQVAGLALYGVLASNMRDNFRFIMSDGGFMAYCGFFDTDNDGKISEAEFEADPKKYREKVFRNAPFTTFDKDKDGEFTSADMQQLTKMYLDAIDNENFALLNMWAKTAAGVATPDNWFQDHFEHPVIWTFLEQLDIPVGLFHGARDSNTPIGAVRELEKQSLAAGKTKMEYFYFDDLDHSLNIGEYFSKGTMPAGHQAIFDFIERHCQ